ncbi:13448_t:CDS:2 [Cetraspora pellucida]|uniref:13448_t:CDS:1 n=1 Tax=Cetraspora pellucida TaxID=1433469 RepID=A0A9N9P3I7_9GLOM|nr:13448_t:CDS:2 [Cetraspora pellucida]
MSNITPPTTSTLSLALCSLCPKSFKNQHVLQIHEGRMHYSVFDQATTSSAMGITCVSCLLCSQKTYKNKQSLGRHEQLIHSDYNTPRTGVTILPPDAVYEFKKMLVYLIQTKLSNNSNFTGKQRVTAPCTESQFVAVFGKHLRCYVPRIRQYTQQQQTAVILFSLTDSSNNFSNSENLETDSEFSKKKKQQKRKLIKSNTFEFNIEWKIRTIIDTVNHTSQAGYITIRFVTDTRYF